MSNKTFTQKEIEVLRTSPYVQNVSQSMVFFSASFKEQFWKMLCEGKAPRDIVIALGIDPDILGDNRIAGLKAIVKREVKAGKGFRDYITYTGGSSNYMSPEARIKYLEQQVGVNPKFCVNAKLWCKIEQKYFKAGAAQAAAALLYKENHRQCRWFQKALAMHRKNILL